MCISYPHNHVTMSCRCAYFIPKVFFCTQNFCTSRFTQIHVFFLLKSGKSYCRMQALLWDAYFCNLVDSHSDFCKNKHWVKKFILLIGIGFWNLLNILSCINRAYLVSDTESVSLRIITQDSQNYLITSLTHLLHFYKKSFVL